MESSGLFVQRDLQRIGKIVFGTPNKATEGELWVVDRRKLHYGGKSIKRNENTHRSSVLCVLIE